MFPILAPAEIERMRRFGKTRSYRAGEALVEVGNAGLGLTAPPAAARRSPRFF
jgi:thioredoxin reductase (NADPH)